MYLAIADALEADIKSGQVSIGDRLPTQRALAQVLGIDFSTVTRAYAEARQRKLVEGRVGQGTFVLAPVTAPRAAAPVARPGVIDMSMNLPPAVSDPDLVARMWAGVEALRQDAGIELLMRYQDPGGAMRDRAAGAAWLKPRLGDIDLKRILVAPGAQGALTALAVTLAAPGDTILVEALSYPGFLGLARHLRLNLVPVASDAEGIGLAALEEACARHAPKALYCTPTLNNPTTLSWSEDRRRAVAELAQRRQLPIIEDDAYGAIPSRARPALVQLAPDMVYHVASLSKSVAPALRVAYLVVPEQRNAMRASAALRGMTAMASPLTAGLATFWIEEGTAFQILASIRLESLARQQLVSDVLPHGCYSADPEGFHLWLTLPGNWTRSEFVSQLRGLGVAAVASDAFSLGNPPEAVRLGLGAARSRAELSESLQSIRALLLDGPSEAAFVV